MNSDRNLTELLLEFDKKFDVYNSILMMERTTGVRPRFVTMNHCMVERYFDGHKPIMIFGCHVDVDPFCPEDMIYYSKLPFDASLEK